jgi:hypothetical protein
MTGAFLTSLLKQYLQDPEGIVWGSMYLAVINESLKTIAMLRPDATATTTELTLTPNKYSQSIPVDGARLLYITRNITTGKPIRLLKRESLNELGDVWTPQTVTSIEHYIYDVENPTKFGVYPVPDSALKIEIIYSALPPNITDSGIAIINDIYLSPILEHCLYRLYETETERISRDKANMHLTNCYNLLGIKLQNEITLRAIQQE